MLLKKTKSKLWAALISAAFGVLALLLAAEVASAAPCDITAGAPFIRHDLTASPSTSNSYCELCGTGYITVIIYNPYDLDTSMTNMTVEEDLISSGLTYVDGSTQAWVNSSPVAVLSDPDEDGSRLTWTSTNIPSLLSLAARATPPSTLTIRFAVDPVDEALHIANPSRAIKASLTYTPVDASGSPAVECLPGSTTEVDDDTLPLREITPDEKPGIHRRPCPSKRSRRGALKGVSISS